MTHATAKTPTAPTSLAAQTRRGLATLRLLLASLRDRWSDAQSWAALARTAQNVHLFQTYLKFLDTTADVVQLIQVIAFKMREFAQTEELAALRSEYNRIKSKLYRRQIEISEAFLERLVDANIPWGADTALRNEVALFESMQDDIAALAQAIPGDADLLPRLAGVVATIRKLLKRANPMADFAAA